MVLWGGMGVEVNSGSVLAQWLLAAALRFDAVPLHSHGCGPRQSALPGSHLPTVTDRDHQKFRANYLRGTGVRA